MFKILKSKLLVISYLLLVNSSLAFAQSVLEPPTFVHPEEFYPPEEALYIEGVARPDAKIIVEVRKIGQDTKTFFTIADSDGLWSLYEKIDLGSGAYEIRAGQQIGETVSEWSESSVIRGINTGFTAFSWDVKYFYLAALALLILTPLAIIAIYFWLKIRRLKKWIDNEI